MNHPHIGLIYGSKDAQGVKALVLELVEDQLLRSGLLEGEFLSMRHWR